MATTDEIIFLLNIYSKGQPQRKAFVPEIITFVTRCVADGRGVPGRQAGELRCPSWRLVAGHAALLVLAALQLHGHGDLLCF